LCGGTKTKVKGMGKCRLESKKNWQRESQREGEEKKGKEIEDHGGGSLQGSGYLLLGPGKNKGEDKSPGNTEW